MTIERTLTLLKPDAIERNITGKIIAKIEENGFKIVAQKRLQLTKQQAEIFYREHKLKEFFPSLVDFMCSNSIVAMVLEKENCILDYRKLMGATKPDDRAEGTIRKEFAGNDIQRNCVHGSDCVEVAYREIHFFFSDVDLI